MKTIATFQSERWGTVTVLQGTYVHPNGPAAIRLTGESGPLATVSVNVYATEWSHESRDLPPGCFYVKTYEPAVAELAREALAAGIFVERPDLPKAHSRYATVPAWQVHGVAS